jgi:hypothetical protein
MKGAVHDVSKLLLSGFTVAELEAVPVLEDDSSVKELERGRDGIILLWSMALGSKGSMPHFAKPALMLHIENTR